MFVKRAWIRNQDAPIGKPAPGRINCPCGNAPESMFDPSNGDVFCTCGRRYSWDGWIKGKSTGSETLTAYRVIFEDGTGYSTSMSESTTLDEAARYFMGRTIEGKKVSDVQPC